MNILKLNTLKRIAVSRFPPAFRPFCRARSRETINVSHFPFRLNKNLNSLFTNHIIEKEIQTRLLSNRPVSFHQKTQPRRGSVSPQPFYKIVIYYKLIVNIKLWAVFVLTSDRFTNVCWINVCIKRFFIWKADPFHSLQRSMRFCPKRFCHTHFPNSFRKG